MENDNFNIWIKINMKQICEENNIIMESYEDYQHNKFFIYEELSKRFDIEMQKEMKRRNELFKI